MNLPATDKRIRELRPPKSYVDPFHAHGTVLEKERRPGGKIEETLTVFLAGAECPFACSFCDLWQWTITGPTPPGALAAQLQQVLGTLGTTRPDRIKLYNASNFFDPRAVPTADVNALSKLLATFDGITVESHASTIGRRAVAFARSISGRLEVAMGLETIHPVALAESNKRLDLTRFDRAMSFLLRNGMDVRVFVLLGMPYVPQDEVVQWTVRTVEYAIARGASVVSIIPVRSGNGELQRLQSIGKFAPPTLRQLEDALREAQSFERAAVTADLWDIDRLDACGQCKAPRIEALRVANLTGRLGERTHCAACNDA
ncbi:MAG TPA: hypothetical protein VJ840_09055 [Gemmatimonadaceae bacterium]|nr:hypothetical protein [Gemmatimonadaceae bacterium]